MPRSRTRATNVAGPWGLEGDGSSLIVRTVSDQADWPVADSLTRDRSDIR
jgi:hypothetical protein